MDSNFDDMVKMTKESLSVIQMIEALGCAPMEDGFFYRTFNDSLVIVTKLRRKVNVEIHVPDFLRDMFPEKIDAIVEEKKKEEEEKAYSWRAMVIEGGHGIDEIVGEVPGESYVLDKNGCFDLIEKNKRYVQALSMSLRKKLCHYNDIQKLQLGTVDG